MADSKASAVSAATTTSSQTGSAIAAKPIPAHIQSYQLAAGGVCDAINTASKIVGLTVKIYGQCGSADLLCLEIPCAKQTADGVTWRLNSETDETETACSGSGIPYLTNETIEVEIGVNAEGLFDDEIYNFFTGSQVLADGRTRAYGRGSVKPFILELDDEINKIRTIFPLAYFMPDSIEIARTSKSAPTTTIMFRINKTTDSVTREQYFSDTWRY